LAADTHAEEVFSRHRQVWAEKAVLRRVYHEEFFSRLLAFGRPGGVSIEAGGGPGFFKEALPTVISTDLVWSPWVDAVANAQTLPFRSCSTSNIFGLDVLHHLAEPMWFLQEAERILIPGGRLILVEPWITPLSYIVYRFLHQEGCDLYGQPWEKSGTNPTAKNAFDGNPAIPYLLFGARNRKSTLASFPQLMMLTIEPFCLFAYLLSFGFKRANLLPGFLYGAVSTLERRTLPLWRDLAALRVLLVLEKRAG
jgi:SAM-dependent methyltransferase